MGKLIDIKDHKFGRLIVKYRIPNKQSDTRAYWMCLCDCGATSVVSGKALRSGSTKSCGCIAAEWAKDMGSRKEFIAKRSETITKHGHKRKNSMTKEYATWLRIKQRCYDEKCKDYLNWGGRGIVVCDEWIKSFETFLSDMGYAPFSFYQIDRLNPNDNYRPGNCRWTSPTKQSSENRRNLTIIEIDGMTFQSISAACRHYGTNVTTAHYRINKGVDIITAVSTSDRHFSFKRSRESYLPRSKR